MRTLYISLQAFNLTLKHNTVQYLIKNTGETSVKNEC